MQLNIDMIIPTLMEAMETDQENESQELLDYYIRCTTQERAVVNNVMLYLCGWTFETLLEKCDIKLDEQGNPVLE